jgi:hypothetical protein
LNSSGFSSFKPQTRITAFTAEQTFIIDDLSVGEFQTQLTV